MILLSSFKTAPEQKTYSETALKVRTVTAQLQDISVSTTEYGTARPLRTVTISSEVTGRIIAMREGLKSGIIVSKGEELLSIDSRDYEIALTVAMAKVEKLDSELRSLGLSMSSDALRLIALEKDFRISLKNLERKRKLFKQNAATEADVDVSEQENARKQSAYLSLKNAVELYPVQRRSLNAQLESAKASAELAEINVKRCSVIAPFRGRLTAVTVEKHQYVRQGEKLLSIADESSLEIPVSVAGASAIKLGLRPGDSADERFRLSGAENITAELRWAEMSGSNKHSITGKVVRIEKYSSESRTVGLIVQPDSRTASSPLVSGMFCRVDLTAEASKPLVAIPRSAVQFGGRVFSVDSQSRLQERKVSIYHRNEKMLFLDGGIEDGAVIVSSKLPFDLVNGMKVTVADPKE